MKSNLPTNIKLLTDKLDISAKSIYHFYYTSGFITQAEYLSVIFGAAPQDYDQEEEKPHHD
jgi:hypothetical protein